MARVIWEVSFGACRLARVVWRTSLWLCLEWSWQSFFVSSPSAEQMFGILSGYRRCSGRGCPAAGCLSCSLVRVVFFFPEYFSELMCFPEYYYISFFVTMLCHGSKRVSLATGSLTCCLRFVMLNNDVMFHSPFLKIILRLLYHFRILKL